MPTNSTTIQIDRTTARTKPPPRYQVILLNDDLTPMDFVVDVLMRFFSKTSNEAMTIMLQVHTMGKGICGVYTKDIAATKVSVVMQYARMHQHPLLCTMEQAPD